jgi:hypothetical protein
MTLPKDRQALSLPEIYEAAGYADVMTFDRFGELITHAAQELELPVGKLRVTDRFDNELKPDFWRGTSEGLAMLSFDIQNALKRHNRKGEKLIVSTLDEYLRLMNELY